MSLLMPSLEKMKNNRKMYINLAYKHIKTDKEVSVVNIESETQSKVEKSELRGSG